MSARTATALAALLAASSPASAQSADFRQPGDVYFDCSATHETQMLVFHDMAPRMATRQRGGRVEILPWPASDRDRYSGQVQVDADGSLRDLSMSWSPPGILGWPRSWRTDLHPLRVDGRLERPWLASGTRTLFTPAALDIELTFHSERKLSGQWAFQLGAQRYWRGRPELIALAGIPHWRRSASTRLRAPVLEALAAGERRLSYTIAPVSYWNQARPQGFPQTGLLDLAFLPAVYEGFRALEARLLERIARPAELCERKIEPEPPEDATIATTPAR